MEPPAVAEMPHLPVMSLLKKLRGDIYRPYLPSYILAQAKLEGFQARLTGLPPNLNQIQEKTLQNLNYPQSLKRYEGCQVKPSLCTNTVHLNLPVLAQTVNLVVY